MTATTQTCIAITCNLCGDTLTDESESVIPHFDTIQEARDFQDAWDEDYRWSIQDDGYAVCPPAVDDDAHRAALAALAPAAPVVQVPGQQEIPFAGHEDTPCRFDHHGDCQEHGSSGSCQVAEARRVLGLDGAEEAPQRHADGPSAGRQP